MPLDRFQLLDWLLPHCQPSTACILYQKYTGMSPGWVNGEADVARAIAAYREGTLFTQRFTSTTRDGKAYAIFGGKRLGLVPHRDGQVARCCLDFDDHAGDGGNVHLAQAYERFLGADAIKFTSKGGKGLHCFFALAEPVPVEVFLKWAKSWGFNKQSEVECFPKTKKRTQVWLPNEPNENGGDAYLSGDTKTCVITTLPSPPTGRPSRTSVTALRGRTSLDPVTETSEQPASAVALRLRINLEN